MLILFYHFYLYFWLLSKFVLVIMGCNLDHCSLFKFQEIIVIGESDGCRPFSSLLEDDGKAFPENVDIDAEKDMCGLPYSSGTTGLPKGVMLSHYNVIANLQQMK